MTSDLVRTGAHPEGGHEHAAGTHTSHDHAHRHHDHAHAQHHHAHGPSDFRTAFLIGTLLNLGVVVVEVIAGIQAHSMSLLADAGHNLSDVLGLALGWAASVLSTRRPSARRTYGMRRASI